MSGRPELKLDWCSYAAAKYAVEHWHYSRTMPLGKLVKIGVWESGVFIGAVIYSTGASPQLHKAFGLSRFAVCELVRIALDHHRTPVSRVIKIAIRMLKGYAPGLRLIIAFADPEQSHVGTVYQASGWLYLGRSSPGLYYRVHGKLTHNRNLQGPKGFMGRPTAASQQSYTQALRQGQREGSIVAVKTAPKFKYLYPLDAAMRVQLSPLAKPYPKRAASIAPDAPPDQGGEGGWQPTAALQHCSDVSLEPA